jgi:translation initiation factor 2 subunit 2
MKKKKKKGKKGGFDLEAFEKELGEGGDVDGDEEATEALKEGGDDADLGDDPFARDEGAEAGSLNKENAETWHGTDRDYTYQEVSGKKRR